nr:hypothetical protein CFP56_64870 [Quercus suber]
MTPYFVSMFEAANRPPGFNSVPSRETASSSSKLSLPWATVLTYLDQHVIELHRVTFTLDYRSKSRLFSFENMSNKDRICIEVFHRNQLSIGQANRQRYGLATYHWAVLIRPRDFSRIAQSASYDVTDASRQPLDGGFGDLNPGRNWWFRSRLQTNPFTLSTFLAAVIIGKLPKGIRLEQVENILAQVPLPRKNQIPAQHCATWIQDAVIALQQAGYVEQISVDTIMKAAMEQGDRVLYGGAPADDEGRFINMLGRV